MIMKMQHEIAKEEIKESTMDCNKTFFFKNEILQIIWDSSRIVSNVAIVQNSTKH